MPLADVVLIMHFFYVLFVVGSLPLIWIGAYFKHSFVRNPLFRYLHLAAILFVVIESLLGVVCPLTALENSLRQVETESSFIQHWVHQILFYSFPEYVFTTIYIAFASLVAATFKWIPPQSR
ncbi:DUF2784 domain-containing protein [Nitrosomonas aestuarii]|uniref:DUF2784 domain-containing protein n=1 Tax=Nitrosomonas aestuarii TaxID=52441 RepID=UPI000D326B7F|nr:DUF2784 domain-containing protein [Nitrosomonas aestuarii]PTN11321.1 uncharacterized protein DUF2784 [Nitrosomonas aestuarii]